MFASTLQGCFNTTCLFRKHDVHGSVYHNTNFTEITNKMRPCSRIYYSSVS